MKKIKHTKNKMAEIAGKAIRKRKKYQRFELVNI